EDRIFLADYRDTRGATVESDGDSELRYRVHAAHDTGDRAVVVANYEREDATYTYEVPGADDLTLARPGADDETVPAGGDLALAGDRVHVLLE
ncbi:MAG: hypothetical protein ABEJ30_05240, partial [Halorientalis sp.]